MKRLRSQLRPTTYPIRPTARRARPSGLGAGRFACPRPRSGTPAASPISRSKKYELGISRVFSRVVQIAHALDSSIAELIFVLDARGPSELTPDAEAVLKAPGVQELLYEYLTLPPNIRQAMVALLRSTNASLVAAQASRLPAASAR